MIMSVEEKMLTFKTFDDEEFVLEESIAIRCRTIKNIVDDDCASSVIPLPNITGSTMAKIVEYLKKHEDGKLSKDELKQFDDGFVKRNYEELFEILLAANYLDIQELLQKCCEKTADKIKDLSVERVRQIFKIENDLTPLEEKQLRNEYAWAFEGVRDREHDD